MKKILVLLTGGTIGSVVSGDVVGLTEGSPYILIREYEKKYGKDVEFEIINPVNILSENLEPFVWEKLFNPILGTELTDYSGIIITHGTDTLSYTSAMAGFLLSHLEIPVMLVASRSAIGEEDSNGLANFRNAVCLIREGIKGVFTVFSDLNGNNNVYIATRLLEADGYFDEFSAFGGEVYGRVVNEKLNMCRTNETVASSGEGLCDRVEFKNRVMIISPYPGMDYSAISLENPPAAILHMMYHSSTANEKGLEAFAKRCEEKGIDIYLSPFKKSRKKQYESTHGILKSDVTPIYGMSKEAAYAKLMLAYNLGIEDKKAFVAKNIFYEITE